jgi:hypothetical protein
LLDVLTTCWRPCNSFLADNSCNVTSCAGPSVSCKQFIYVQFCFYTSA